VADIRPLQAWRYNKELARDIETLSSPLFDVVSTKQLATLYKLPFNSIHLSVPQGDRPAERALDLLNEWKKNGIVVQDKLPAIYVYYQYFTLPGSSRELCRKGFVCHIRIHDWSEGIILRHENTIPKSVNDRIELLEKTQLHVSPTHGLYTDAEYSLEHYMDEAIRTPLYETEDYQGVRDVLAVIHDAGVIRQFMRSMHDKTIILADGHHRYESSLVYRNKMKSLNPEHTGEEGYNFHLIYLTNTVQGDLRILPTHRIINGLPDFSETQILEKLERNFIIKPIEDPETLNEVIIGKKWAFGMLFKENAYKVRLKPEALTSMPWHFPELVKELDLTVMHYFIIDQVLGIPGKEQRHSEHIHFDRSFADCLTKVIREEAQMAIITNEVSIEDVVRVCHSGATLPQKSTYFYPKVICGFLFSSIRDDEFSVPEISPFASA
jgi:uncharacterized protein (DUF1015 family)